jgi:hypothetical protein
MTMSRSDLSFEDMGGDCGVIVRLTRAISPSR